ncbi:hypothetical protein ElyMa_005398800 [Elysia marginata]|uniref:PiggyBac transposable element-derived protein domain-containing protein n=1 Tax=Elysia marginata TaxID=1093978 RepID=A0AAV4EG90_9GAST|nr:hypothetical protein ElyMa_005398800 [Elysia marginata]
MLPGARPVACKPARLNHQDPRSNAHGSHLTPNKVPNSRERSRFRWIEESDGTTEARQEDGKKTKQEGKSLSLAAFYCVTRDKHTQIIKPTIAADVVYTLTSDFKGIGPNITCDNYFTDVNLANGVRKIKPTSARFDGEDVKIETILSESSRIQN